MRLSTMDRTQNGPSYNSSAAMYPEKPSRAQSRESVPMRSAAFFPPGLHPVLDGGERDKDAMIAPEVPACSLIGQAVLDNQSHRQGDDAMRVVGLGHGVVGHVGVEVLSAAQ